MPRPPRLEFDGGLYHLITRGNRRERVFDDDDDRQRFLNRLRTVTTDSDIELYAFAFMTNHVHFVVRRRHMPVSRFMHLLLAPYGRYFNKRHELVGHVFQGRYKALLCQDETYLMRLVRYVHRNPLRSGLSQDLIYRWSSYGWYLDSNRGLWLSKAPVLRLFGRQAPEARRAFIEFHESEDSDSEPEEVFTGGRRGVLGDEKFVAMAYKRAARSFAPRSASPPSLDEILEETLAETGIRVEPVEVRGPSRCLSAREARRLLVHRAVTRYGYSYAEVAGYLGRSPSGLRVLLHRQDRRS
jgi:REP element-mobilizing transposase RayT